MSVHGTSDYLVRCRAWVGRYVTKFVRTKCGAYWLVEKVVSVEHAHGKWLVRLERVNDDAPSMPPGTRSWVSASYFDKEMRPDSPDSEYRETLVS